MASLSISLLLLLSFFSTSAPRSAASDATILLEKIKPSLQGSLDNLLLSTWNASFPICRWRGLKWSLSNGSPLLCDESSPSSSNLSLTEEASLQLLSIQLPAAGLSGEIPKEIGELSSLQSLYLGVNSLTGPLPLELGNSPSLADVDLVGNALNGSLPASIWNLCDRLVSIRLHGNRLSGFVPDPALPNSTCRNLQFLDWGNNRLEGEFPGFLVNFSGLKYLDLGNNLFSGSIPESLSGLNLDRLNLSYNNFSGVLPAGAPKFGSAAFVGNNPELCGSPLGKCSGSSGLSSGAIAGIVIGLMAGVVVLASVSIGYVQGKRRKNRAQKLDEDEEREDEENGSGVVGGAEGKLVLFQGGEHLTLEDVLNATGQVMEKTSYGTVYKAKLVDGGTIALRLLREGSCKDRASCLPVIRHLGRVRHENLVPLRAFYQGERGEKLLIYDYLPNKSLHDLLHGEQLHDLFALSSLHVMFAFDSVISTFRNNGYNQYTKLKC